jgi:hypothetical protein
MTVARPWYLLLVLFVACNGSGKTPILLDQTGTLDQAAADIGPEVPAPEEVLPEVGPVDVTPEIAPADVGTEVIPETVEADVCVPDCGGRECGDDGCGGSCGDCINDCDPFCEGLEPQVDPDLCMEEEGFCARVCCPSCCDKACGDDGCGGVCGQCGELEVCHEDFCICQFESCGEGCCPDGEVCFGEKCCVPSCEGKACGGDGCGGSCGQCGEGNFCNAGACAEICESDCVPGAPTCEGTGGYLECLLVCEGCDGAGGDCYQNALTECDAGTWCQGGECVCAPKCAGKVCGDDGCGGSCGSCGANEICVAGGKCACKFAPCGDACCAQGAVCHDGACCTPVCTGMECGDDGCGGSCGDCDAGCYCGGGTAPATPSAIPAPGSASRASVRSPPASPVMRSR